MIGRNLARSVHGTHGRYFALFMVSACLAGVAPSIGAERKFAVMLANSPKEYPNTDLTPSYMPPEGLMSFAEIHKRYFGQVTGSECYSGVKDFATYWKEISYGDVTISGQAFDWVSLPWAIQPPLRMPEDDAGSTGGALDICGYELSGRSAPAADDTQARNSPVCYTDLQQPLPDDPGNPGGDPDEEGCPPPGASDSRQFAYGAAENFNQARSQSIIDADGDPEGDDNGPYVAGPGLGDVSDDYVDYSNGNAYAYSINGPAGKDVFTPGERFIDIDGDERWDALDETSNLMDLDGNGFVDLAGPWVDLDGSEAPNNSPEYCSDTEPPCIYLQDVYAGCIDEDEDGQCCTYDPDTETVTCDEGTFYKSCTNRAECVSLDLLGNIIDCPNTDCPAQAQCSGACPECFTAYSNVYFGEPCEDDTDCGGVTDDAIVECQNTAPWRREFDDSTFDPIFRTPDGIPDCAEAPDGSPLDPAARLFLCTATITGEFEDCNGNAQDDDLDIFEGTSLDEKDWACIYPSNLCEDGETENCCPCEAGVPCDSTDDDCPECDSDDIPDDCQETMLQEDYDDLPARCEFVDANCDNKLDTPEPYEDFLRRWEPCIEDGDASDPTGQHWIKTYDPHSDTSVVCTAPAPVELQLAFDYWDPVYIYSNYPGDTTMLRDRAGNGVFDPSDSWTEMGNTKMQWQEGPAFRTATALPGAAVPGYDDPWYEAFWADRYDNFPAERFWGPDYEAICEAIPDDPFCSLTSSPAVWPKGDKDPAPPDYSNSAPNTPAMIAFDPTKNKGSDDVEGRRYFQANRGGFWGDGSGWLSQAVPASGPDSLYVAWETGVGGGFDSEGDAQCSNCVILPEEVNGLPDQEPTIYYDGWVEHDDLPSSKYHHPGFAFPYGSGDKRLGEVTSPTSPNDYGQDNGDNDPGTPDGPDGFTIAGGPYAINSYGSKGRDGGNVLLLEWLTWRTDGTSPSFGIGWEVTNGSGHPFAGPGSLLSPNVNFGFRDYNLDGMIDQGEVRPAGSDNYIADSDQSSPNNGTGSRYPFNRQRIMEDVVAALDAEVDFDEWVDANSMNAVTSGAGNCIDLNGGGCTEGVDLITRGYVSGIVMLPPNTTTAGEDPPPGGGFESALGFFPYSPTWYPIHNEDEADINGDQPYHGQLNFNLWFHDLVTDRLTYAATGPTRTAAGNLFLLHYSCHEYGHAWEHWPDLYDYDILTSGGLINYPIGFFCLMTNQGQVVHPIAPLKENSTFIDPIDLATVLTPNVPQVVTMVNSENFRNESYFFFENPLGTGERYYFYYEEFLFDEPKFFNGEWVQGMPGPGMLIVYTDFDSNFEGLPQQQISGTHMTYKIVAADGLEEGPAGVNEGDTGDPWPGDTNNTGPWNDSSSPSSRWDFTRPSGISITENGIIPVSGGVLVNFLWEPTDVPNLTFFTPPGGVSVNGIYQIQYRAYDNHGGTTIEFYYTRDPEDYSSGVLLGTTTKPAGVIEDSFDWNLGIDASYSVGDSPFYMVAADFDGDGLPDFAVANNNTDDVSVRLNNGNGTYGEEMVYGVGDAPYYIAAGDLNGDGSPDLAVANTASTDVSVLINNNEGGFAPEVSFELGVLSFPYSVAIGDLNGDSDADLAVTALVFDDTVDQIDQVIILLNDGTGNFPTADFYDVGEFVDTNGDGFEEIDFPVAVAIGDLDGDDEADLAVANNFADQISILLNNGQGKFPAFELYDAGNAPYHVALADLDGDVDLDVAVPNLGDNNVSIFLNNDDGTLANDVTYGTGAGPIALAAGDVDIDGDLDLVAANFGSTDVSVLYNEGDATFTDLTLYPAGSGPASVALADMNDDGFLDIYSANSGSDNVTILLNEGNGTFNGLEDAIYYVFAKLIPGLGGDNKYEAAVSVVRPGRNNLGDGTLEIVPYCSDDGVDPAEECPPDPYASPTAKVESWTVELVLDGVDAVWSVTGSLSGLQANAPEAVPDCGAVAPDDVYVTDGGEISFCIEEGDTPFAVGDRFVFVTTGLTAPTPGVSIVGAEIDDAPRATIRVYDDFPPLGQEVVPAGPAPLTLVFDGTASTDPNGLEITSYVWNFGDGSADVNGATVQHTFDLNGSYTVTLTVTNEANAIGIAQVDVEVINNSPSAQFTANPTSGPPPPCGACNELFVTFNAGNSSDPEDNKNELLYQWDFGDCATNPTACQLGPGAAGEFMQPPEHRYSTANPPQVFVATLTVTDTGGSQDSASVAILVGNNLPTAVITIDDNSVEVDDVVTFDGSASTDPDSGDLPLTDFTWDFGDNSGTKTGAVVTHSYGMASTYTVTLTVDDGRGGVDSATATVTVSPSSGPNAGFSVIPGTTVDLGVTLTFTSTSTPVGKIVSWDWDFDDGGKATGAGPVDHLYAEAGVYKATLTVTDVNDLSDVASQTITVVEPVIPPGEGEEEEDNPNDPDAEFTAAPTLGQAPLVVSFDASGSSDPDGDTLTYAWDFDDGGTGTGPTLSHTFTAAGTFNVVLTVDDGGGRTNQTTRLITVTASSTIGEPPVARIASGPRSGPAPLSISFDGNLSTGDDLTYQWSVVGGSVDTTLDGSVVDFMFADPGTYSVTLKVTDMRLDEDVSPPTMITVTPPVTNPPEPPPPEPVPDDTTTGGGSQRPTSLCGTGMIMSLLAAVGFMWVNRLVSRSRRD